MPTIPEELDVFYHPHNHMKKVVSDIEEQLFRTDFHNLEECVCLVQTLSRGFKDLQSHEEIEDNYILSPLLPLVTDAVKVSLEHDIHSSDRLQGIVCLVDSAHKYINDEFQRIKYGESLRETVISFTSEVIPHMQEEEEVFQPLLIQYYTEPELKALKETVLQLHKQRIGTEVHDQATPTNSPRAVVSLVTLPQELLLKIFSYLDPPDLCRLSATHSSFTDLAFDGNLWKHIHPVRWTNGHWRFHSPPIHKEENGDTVISHDTILSNDTAKYLLSCGDSVNITQSDESGIYHYNNHHGIHQDNESLLLKEQRIMEGLINHVLPKVGKHVEVLDLAYSRALTGEMMYLMLSMCSNLRYLDVSHTMATDYTFRGLVDSGGGSAHLLRYIDLTGCTLITDTALLRIAWASTPPQATPSLKNACDDCTCDKALIYNKEGVADEVCQLECLIVSGCHQITDVGLRSLAIGRGLPNLQYLNLSSVPGISGEGLNALVKACPRIEPHLLFYCDNIANGPHPLDSNGCCDVQNSYKCCQNTFKSY